MTSTQLIVFGILILLVLFVGGLLLLSGRRGTPSHNRNARRHRQPDDLSHSEGVYAQKNDVDSENKAQLKDKVYPDESDNLTNVTAPLDFDTHGVQSSQAKSTRREEQQKLPQVTTDAGQSVKRPETIYNRPPVSLRSRTKLYHYTALVTSVYDGDTLTADIDLGMNIWAKNQVIRLWKVNTPELRGAEREQGLMVRDKVRELVLNKYVLLRTILDKRGQDQTGKYGRLLGEIFVEEEGGELFSVNDYLLMKNWALPMNKDGVTIRKPANIPAQQSGPIPQQSTAPLPERTREIELDQDSPRESKTQQGSLLCPLCGAVRAVDLANHIVLDCPNCIDESYIYQDG